MTPAASGRPAHGARSTVGGGLADWLIGGGVFALLVAAFGMWGLPLLTGSSPGRPDPVPSAAPPPRLDPGPLAVLPGIEAPVPPGAGAASAPNASADASTASVRPPEPLRREVAAIIDEQLDTPTLEAGSADAFVDARQTIALPATPLAERISVEALAEKLGNDPQAEVTVRREVVAVQPRRLVDLLQQATVERSTPASTAPRPLEQIARELQQNDAGDDDPTALARLSRALSEAGIDPAARFTVEIEGAPRELPLTQLVSRGLLAEPGATVEVVERSQSIEKVTLAALEAEGSSEVVQVVDANAAPSRTTTIGELLGDAAGSPDTLYYVRTVQPEDDQGVWGIVQHGVTETFARGVRLGEGEAGETVTLAIPEDADELEGRRSSFLGQLIARKVDASWVYNLDDGRMGRNPHLVYPGQELVIVGFAPAELNDIYAYFSSARD